MDSATQTIKELKGIKIGSINIRSLYRSVDEIKIFLNRTELHVLMLQETFLSDQTPDALLEIPGYSLVRQDRNTDTCKSMGGGLCIYVRNNVTFDVVPNLSECTVDYDYEYHCGDHFLWHE